MKNVIIILSIELWKILTYLFDLHITEIWDYKCANTKKLVKIFYKNPSDYNENNSFSQANWSANPILQTKTDSIAKMSTKLDHPNLALKIYCSVVSRFLNSQKNQLYHLFLSKVKSREV